MKDKQFKDFLQKNKIYINQYSNGFYFEIENKNFMLAFFPYIDVLLTGPNWISPNTNSFVGLDSKIGNITYYEVMSDRDFKDKKEYLYNFFTKCKNIVKGI